MKSARRGGTAVRWTFCLLAWAALSARCAAQEPEGAAQAPAAGLDACILSLPARFLLDPLQPWAEDLGPDAVAAMGGDYGDFLECAGLAGRERSSLPIPGALREQGNSMSEGLGQLLRFYRACGEPDARRSAAACKTLVKTYLGELLDPGADWDALCADWCSQFRAARPGACARLVAAYHAPGLTTEQPLIDACRRFGIFDAEPCPEGGEGSACAATAALVKAVRAKDPALCAPEDWRCQAAASGDAGACAERFGLSVILPLCRERQGIPFSR